MPANLGTRSISPGPRSPIGMCLSDTPIMTCFHFTLLYHRAIRVPTLLLTLSMLSPLYFWGWVTLPTLLSAKTLLSVTMITINHRRSPNYVAFFLNMHRSPRALWGTYLAADLALYLVLAALILWLR